MGGCYGANPFWCPMCARNRGTSRYLKRYPVGVGRPYQVPKKRPLAYSIVQSNQLDAFDEHDIVILEHMANQAAVAIENARLYEQIRQVATLEERQRLARELHDSVTQSLYG